MKEPKVSVVIPYMESDPGKPAILKKCVDHLEGYDELLVIWNWKMGYAKPINKGLALAKGDFMVVMNDDIYLQTGSLRDLCDETAVTSPLIDYQEQPFWGCCFCIPRWVYEKVGGLSEIYKISYYDDDDYINELRKAGVPMKAVTTVNFHNPEGGRTLHTFPDWQQFGDENRIKFVRKWGAEPAVLDSFFKQHGRLPKKDEIDSP